MPAEDKGDTLMRHLGYSRNGEHRKFRLQAEVGRLSGCRVAAQGLADKGQVVKVQFADQRDSAKVNDDGTWQAILTPLAASDKARALVAACDGETVVVADIVVGDVWHASGQSNMAMSVQTVAKHFSQ